MSNPTETPILHCPTCYSTSFQLSKPRPEDRMQIWMLKQPVRCLNCRARIYASRAYANWLRKEEVQRGTQKTPKKAALPAS